MGGSETEALGAGPGEGLMPGEGAAVGLVPGEGLTRGEAPGEGEGTGNGAIGRVPAVKLVSAALTNPGAVTPWML